MNCLSRFDTPQLEKIHAGKVRDSFRIDKKRRMIVVTDRLSAFDSILETPIPYKGAVLNGISNWWFEQTKDIIDNHFIEALDPNINLVKEAVPIRVEVIVRGYITGSMWRGYEKGERVFCGVKVKEGFKKNDKFKKPLVTPTTKEEHDRPISPEDIVKEGWTTAKRYQQMEKVAIELFKLGTKHLEKKGIILVDTKYEFGLVGNKLILIDEIHTPDSSRFWKKADYEKNQLKVAQIDKEYVRQWLIKNKKGGNYPTALSDAVRSEASKRYIEIFETITEQKFQSDSAATVQQRMCHNLMKAGLMKDSYVAIIMGSESDLNHADQIKKHLDKYDICVDMRVTSAHKNGEEIPGIVDEYNHSIEPGAVIAIAGRSNGLGGALAANLNIPVINCPPFRDKTDIMLNINSSLVMPSSTPASTTLYPDNAAHAAMRALNVPRLRGRFSEDIAKVKSGLKDADARVRAAKGRKQIGFK